MTEPIHSLLGDAIADAPPPPDFPAPLAAPNHRGRWMAVAAAVVLIAGAVTAIAVNHGDDHPSGDATTVVPATTAPTTAPTTTPPQDCGALPVPEHGYDGEGTVMTIVTNAQPIEATVTATPATVCIGGTVAATITLRNKGAGTERLEYPMLLLRSSGFPKWEVGQLGTVSLSPGETLVLHADVTMPNAAPGDYRLGVFGLFSGEAPITIEGPAGRSCPPDCAPPATGTGPTVPPTPNCGVHDLAAVEGATDGAMGTEYTPVTLTNTSARACILDQGPGRIQGIDAQGTVHDIDIGSVDVVGANFLKPLGIGILEPGEAAAFVMTTSAACYTATSPKPVVYPTLRLKWIGGVIDMTNTVDVGCGLSYSALGRTPDGGFGSQSAPPTCTDLAPSIVEHLQPFHWLEVTLLNATPNSCRLTQPPTLATQTSGGEITFSTSWGSLPAPPAPLGDGIAAPGESFWLGIDVQDCTATGPTQAWMLRWDGGTSRIDANVDCTTASTSALGFARSHQDDQTLTECRPDQFTANMAGGDGAMGNRRSFIRLTRIGSGACTAPKTPSIDLVAGGQRSHVQATTRLDDYLGTLDLAPTALYPGDRVDYVLVWGGPACENTPPTVTESIITWAGADLPAHYATTPGEQICQKGLRVSPLVVPPPTDQAP